MNWKEFGRKWSWPDQGTKLKFVWKTGEKKRINISVRTVGVLDDTRAPYFVSQWDSRSFELMRELGQSDCWSAQPLQKN